MAPLTGFAQFEGGPPCHDFFAKINKAGEEAAQGQLLRAATI